MKTLLAGAALALVLAACSPKADTPVAGDWKVASDQSRVSFVSIKKGLVVESHHFENVTGDVKASGDAKVVLDLKALKTQPETRFTRMQEHLFQVTQFPQATITAKLDPAKFEGLKVGERRVETIPVNVDLHGQKTDYDAEVYVTRTGADSVVVDTTNPIPVDASDFALTAGLDKLKELAELDAIVPASPVTFSLTFKR